MAAKATPEQKEAVKQHWQNVVRGYGLLYQSGGIKDVQTSIALNASLAEVERFLMAAVDVDCNCPEAPKA